MTFAEALVALNQGFDVRRKIWPENQFWRGSFDESTIELIDEPNDPIDIRSFIQDTGDFLSIVTQCGFTDWEVVSNK